MVSFQIGAAVCHFETWSHCQLTYALRSGQYKCAHLRITMPLNTIIHISLRAVFLPKLIAHHLPIYNDKTFRDLFKLR
ncbi:hypothetical protein SAMN05421862_111139 [Pseudomonas extremaustralis]|nr:hypothetical protein SAMN05421862_111139 [Pseudomonas extremaustralis]